MHKYKLALVVLAAGISFSLIFPTGQNNALFASQAAFAEEEWRTEFDSICAKTQDSMMLDIAELQSLVARSDKLKKSIEELDETRRKVYLKRLQMCRDLYAFVLETKEKK